MRATLLFADLAGSEAATRSTSGLERQSEVDGKAKGGLPKGEGQQAQSGAHRSLVALGNVIRRLAAAESK